MSISVLYTRVSSVDQKTDRQRVKEDDFDKVIEDKCSGAIPIFERPEGSSLKTLIDRQLIKSISVWQIDRCGRDLRTIPVLAPTLPLQIKSPPLIAAPKQDPAFFSITT
ncbi:MAG: recombinase family protein, partial [Wenyingzhuangia sp.]|uniref:recombinase family protein n=1 Tax=Wenyingzhuangia sp. TaxID=1964193 RepID=UPI003219367F